MKGRSIAIGLTKPAGAEPKSLPYKNSQEKKMSPRKLISKETGSTHTSILAHPEGRHFGSP